MIRVTIPWPPRTLHPNGRPHWRIKAESAAISRNDAFLLTRTALRGRKPAFEERIQVRLTFCPPNRHKHDIDGCLSANKAALDGIADALGVDDSRFSLTLERGPVTKGGAVYVEIYE